MKSPAALIWDIASAAEKRRFARVLMLVTVSAVLETFAIASVLPFMASVTNPAGLTDSRFFSIWSEWTGVLDPAAALLPLGTTVLVLVVASAIVGAMSSWYMMSFVWDMFHEVSRRLLVRYLRQPYEYFLGRNSAELSKNILGEVEVAMTGVVIPLVYTFARGVLAILILLLLFQVNATVSVLSLAVFGGAYGLIYAILRGRQGRLGQGRLAANEDRYRTAAEALSGIKAVKALGKEEVFLTRFVRPSRIYARATAQRELVGQLPRFLMESLAMGGIVGLIMFLISRGWTGGQLLPTVVLFAFAGYKLLPSMQQIFASLTTIRFYMPSVERLHEDLVQTAGTSTAHSTDSPATAPTDSPATAPSDSAVPIDPASMRGDIRFDSVSYRYPDAEGHALTGIDIRFEAGKSYGIVGATGSGKTTTVDLLMGLLMPTTGRIKVGGSQLTLDSRATWLRASGYVPQDVFLTDESLAANVAFGVAAEEIDRDQVSRVLDLVGLQDVVARLPEGIDTSMGERGVRLSGGQRQRVGIARALYTRPTLLILDEGTSALDSATERLVLSGIRSLGITLISVAHRLSTLRDADAIAVIAGGQLVGFGSWEELEAENSEFARLSGEGEIGAPAASTSPPDA